VGLWWKIIFLDVAWPLLGRVRAECRACKISEKLRGIKGERKSTVVFKPLINSRIMKFTLLSTVLALLFSFGSSAIGADITSKDSKPTSKYSMEAKANNSARLVTEMSSMGPWPKNNFANRNLLERRTSTEQRILFLRLKRQAGDGSLTLSKYQFGYGTIMDGDSGTTTCSNGAAWEGPNCVYVKYCMNF